MELRDKLHLIIYRVRERGLEIFVRQTDTEQSLSLPEGSADFDFEQIERLRQEIIALEQSSEADASKGIAFEADYHDIPSLKGLLIDDARRLRDQLLELDLRPEGRFVAVKEVAKTPYPWPIQAAQRASRYPHRSEFDEVYLENSTCGPEGR